MSAVKPPLRTSAPGWRLDTPQTLRALAAGLIHAVVYWPSAAFDLVLPLQPGLDLQVRPGLVVPLFVGLTQGPLAGAICGVVGQFLGEVLAGRISSGWALAIGVLQSGLFGFVAGLGHPSFKRFRTLRDFGRMLLWTGLASLAAQLLPPLLVLALAQTLAPGLAVDANVIVSGTLTSIVNAWLLLPAGLLIWDRVR
jgi:hypothetical protein